MKNQVPKLIILIIVLAVFVFFDWAIHRGLSTPGGTVDAQFVAVAGTPPPDAVDEMIAKGYVAKIFNLKTGYAWQLFKSNWQTHFKLAANILLAVVIGYCGAFAFYKGVDFGFISSEKRTETLKYISTARNILWFSLLGGLVAGVFQWAQADVLAPIQAFVLGATWPSVVTRIMSGGSPTAPTPAQIVNSGAVVTGQPNKAEVTI